MNGADFDIEKECFEKVFCVYWDSEGNILQECCMWAETLYPIHLIDAIRIFKPEFAVGCNCTFVYPVPGRMTDVIVFKNL